MKKIVVFLIFLIFQCFANNEETNAYFRAISTGETSALINNTVNAITGDFIINHKNIIANGIEPINFDIMYVSKNSSCKWSVVNRFFASISENNLFSVLTMHEPNGIILTYLKDEPVDMIDPIKYKNKKSKKKEDEKRKKEEEKQIYFEGMEEFYLNEQHFLAGLSNCSNSGISARLNLKNNKVYVNRKRTRIEVHCSNGTKRYYESFRKNGENKKPSKMMNIYFSSLFVDFRLVRTIYPNGNQSFYHYDNINGTNIPYISHIKTTNPTNTKTYADITIALTQDTYNIRTSDNKTCFLNMMKESQDSGHRKFDFSNKPNEQVYFSKLNDKLDFCYNRTFPDNKKITIDYYCVGNHTVNKKNINIPSNEVPEFGRVKTINLQTSNDDKLIPIYNFIYYPGKIGKTPGYTEVYDVDNNKTVFRYSKYLRITSIERYDNNQNLKNSEAFAWGEEKQNYQNTKDATFLYCKAFLDSKRNVIFAKRFFYDEEGLGNPIREVFYGNLSGKNLEPIKLDNQNFPIEKNLEFFCLYKEFSKDGKNLIIKERNDNGISIHYEYLPNTDLIASKILVYKGKIMLREFYEYDPIDNVLIKEIIDDGNSFDKNILTNVTKRKIKNITLKSDYPFINMPLIIEDKYLDLSSNEEKLLTKIKLTYSPNGEITQEDIYDSNNNFSHSIKKNFDSRGRLISETNPINQIAKYDYDENFNKKCEKPFSDKVKINYKYDFSNRLIEKEEIAEDNSSHISKFKYDFKSNLKSTTDYLGNTIENEYDNFSNLIKIQYPKTYDENLKIKNPNKKYKYDDSNRITEEIDSKNNSKKIFYNSYNKPVRIVFSDGTEEKFIYNLDGTLKYQIDVLGIKTELEYDYLKRITKTTKFLKNGKILATSENVYSPFNLISKKDFEGNLTVYKYDYAGRMISEKINNNEVKYYYDSLSRLYKTEIVNLENSFYKIEQKDLLNRTIQLRYEDLNNNILTLEDYAYDSFGNKSKIIKNIQGINSIEMFFYDAFNRLISHIDPLYNKTNYEYIENHQNDLTQKVLQKIITDPMKLKTIETYNALSKLASIQKVRNNKMLSKEELFYDLNNNLSYQKSTVIAPNSTNIIKTFWKYNTNNLLEELIENYDTSEEKITSYTYTPNKLIKSITKPDKTILMYTYDDLGFQNSLKSSDDAINYSYSFNKLGHLILSKDENTSEEILREVDYDGKILKETSLNKTIENKYDFANRKIEQILPDNSKIEYIFDSFLLKKIKRKDFNGNEKYSHNFLKYDKSGNLLSENLIYDYKTVDYSFDLKQRKVLINSPYFKQTIDEFNSDGTIKKMTFDSSWGQDISEFEYDDLKQITSEKGFFENKHLFDSRGNPLQKNENSFEVNKLNQIISIDETKFEYDKNGNPISKNSDIKSSYRYDALDRLIEIEKESDYKILFTYDSLNRRTSKTFYQWSFVSYYKDWNQTYTEKYLYDDKNEIGIFRDDKLSHFRVLKPSKQAEIGSSISIEIDSQVYIPIHDIQGNITQIINPKNNYPEENYRYSAFGQELIYDSWSFKRSYSPLNNFWRYSSKHTDESSLVFFGRRYYDPEIGRWLTPDPKGLKEGLNLYLFVLNDPLIYNDLYGLEAFYKQPSTYYSSMFGASYYAAKYAYNKIFPDKGNYQTEVYNINSNYNGKEMFTCINGVDTPPNRAKAMGRSISDYAGGKSVNVVYNPTHGKLRDFARALDEICDKSMRTSSAENLIKTWTSMLDNNKTHDIFHFAHSEGGAITRNALLAMKPEYQKRIRCLEINGAAHNDKTMCKSVDAFASKRDFVPLIDISGLIKNGGNIKFLKPAPGAPRLDHAYDSATFKGSIKSSISDYLENPLSDS